VRSWYGGKNLGTIGQTPAIPCGVCYKESWGVINVINGEEAIQGGGP